MMYFFDSSAAPGGDGSEDRPFNNLGKLNDVQVCPGDSIVLLGDRFIIQDHDDMLRLTFSGAPGAPVRIIGNGVNLVGTRNLPGIWTNTNGPEVAHIEIRDLLLRGFVGNYALKLYHTRDVLVSNLSFMDVIRGERPWCCGAQVRYSHNVTFNSCRFSDIEGEGIYLGTANDQTDDILSDILVTHCSFHNTQNEGVDGKAGCINSAVTHSYFRNCGAAEKASLKMGARCMVSDVSIIGPRNVDDMIGLRMGMHNVYPIQGESSVSNLDVSECEVGILFGLGEYSVSNVTLHTPTPYRSYSHRWTWLHAMKI